MSRSTKRSKPLSGGARLMASGRRPVTLGLLPEQLEKIRAAAQLDNRPVTQFLTHHGLVAAEIILLNQTKKA